MPVKSKSHSMKFKGIDPLIMDVGIKRYMNRLIANLRQSKKKQFSGLVNMHSKNISVIWKITTIYPRILI